MFLKRILSVVIGAPIVIGVILCPQTAVFKIFVVVCIAIALWEFYTIVGLTGKERLVSLALAVVHHLYLVSGWWREGVAIEHAVLLILFFFLYCSLKKDSLEGIAQKCAFSILGAFYLSSLGSFVALARDLPDGIYWVLTLLAMTWLNDTFAYFFGRQWGRHRLAPLISPKKSIEGFLGGFLGSFLGFFLFWKFLNNPLQIRDGIILTLLVGLVGPLGDLSESLIKRGFHVKDSGHIIPGHGGMLDRIDALIFVAPVVYGYAMWMNL